MRGLRLRSSKAQISDKEQVEELFAFQLRNLAHHHLKGAACARQHRFAAEQGRKWSFDFAFPTQRLAVELNGGIWAEGGRGAHSRPANIERDMAKGNAAVLLGWRVLSFTPAEVRSGHALAFTEAVLLKIIHNEPGGAPCPEVTLPKATPRSSSDPRASSPESRLLTPRRRSKRRWTSTRRSGKGPRPPSG